VKTKHQAIQGGIYSLVVLMSLWTTGVLGAQCHPNGICTEIYEPVCGVDGRTYSNSCRASNACVDVDYKGVCKEPPPVCQDLDKDGFSPIGGDCGPIDCNDRDPVVNPEMACAEIYEPVCGVDGKTYPNACEALRLCVAVDHKGECEQPTECPDNDQDGYSPVGGACGLKDCNDEDPSMRPDLACYEIYSPVCGVDNKTYANACIAKSVCASVAHKGRCDMRR
jgi:hypothetical protein